MIPILTNEEFLAKLLLVNPNITSTEEYVRSNIKIGFKCKICEHEWSAAPNNILRGRKCPKCSEKARVLKRTKTHEQFLEELKLINKNIIPIEKYVKRAEKIKFKCQVCDNEFSARPANILSGEGCPVCSEKLRANKRIIPFDDVISKLTDICPDVQILGEYKGTTKQILCKCLKCNNMWEPYVNVLLNGHGCPKCAHKRLGNLYRKSLDDFIQEMFEVNKDIEIIGEYINYRTKIQCRCKVCNRIFRSAPDHLLSGKGCSHCTKSKGEKRIKQYIEDRGIEYIPQKTYDNLRGIGGGLLSYDFYIPQYNLLIEFQGQFHDGSANIQTKNGFAMQQEHDKRKQEYAQNHNIELLEIWYYEFDNIEQILNKVFTQQINYKGENDNGAKDYLQLRN